jgi:hypothetical protein
MKKKSLKSTCFVALASAMIAGGWCAYAQNDSQMEQLLLTNIDALSNINEQREVIEVKCYAKLSNSWMASGTALKCPDGTFIGGSAYESGKKYTCGNTYGKVLPSIATSKCYRIK